jgi:dUTP pyrophosphatase
MKIQLSREHAVIPVYATAASAGADLYTCEDVTITPLTRKLVATGVIVEIPEGYYGRIAPRSGLAFNFGIDVLAGVIDSDYRGEIKVLLFNSGDRVFTAPAGHRIAQLIIEQHFRQTFEVVEEIQATERGAGGFGSTGSK